MKMVHISELTDKNVVGVCGSGECKNVMLCNHVGCRWLQFKFVDEKIDIGDYVTLVFANRSSYTRHRGEIVTIMERGDYDIQNVL